MTRFLKDGSIELTANYSINWLLFNGFLIINKYDIHGHDHYMMHKMSVLAAKLRSPKHDIGRKEQMRTYYKL